MTDAGSWTEWAHRLEGDLVRDDAGQLVIRCPGPDHSKADRSLQVWLDEDEPGGFRVFSHATGDPDWRSLKDYVRGRVGAPPFKPNGKANGHDKARKGTVEAHYVYQGAMGDDVLRVTRMRNPKGFFQSHPDGSGGWTSGGIEVGQLVPYRLPELIEGIGLGRVVHICEGEKGVQALAKLGLTATCSPMGALKWPDHFRAWFNGADVVVLADNDEPGRKHAQMVADNLAPVAQVRIVNLPGLPPGGDVYDYLEKGGDALAIQVMRPGPPKRGYTAAELWSMEFPPVAFAVPRYIAEGLTLLAGAPKRGKSWLALDLCCAVAWGGSALGVEEACVEGDSLYCALEDSPRRIKERLHRVCEHADRAPGRLDVWFGADLPRLGAGCEEAIRGWLTYAAKPRLVVVDTLNFVRPERTRDEDPYSYDYRTASLLQRIAQDHGVALVMVHHTRKSLADDYLESISGTNGLTGGSDAVMVLEKGHEGAYALKGRGRDIEEFDVALRFDAMSCRWEVLGDSQEAKQSDTRRRMLGVLRQATWLLGPSDIAALTNLSPNVVRQHLFQMERTNDVVRVKHGKYKLKDKEFVIEGGRSDDDD